MKQATKLILIFIFFTNYLPAQTNSNPERKIDSLFSKYNSKTPGVAVAIVKDGEIIFKKGYGMANLEYDVPISPKTIFNVGSVSKQFTTFSIYLLEKQGKISLDDDIRKYIPELPVYEKTITIKHLCSHTSGLKDQWSLLTLAGWRMDDIITSEQVLKLISKQKELNFTPGSQFKYSNTGFSLLAEIIKRVSGKSFGAFAKENIFNPLGMENTLLYDDNEKIVKNRAYSYGEENGLHVKRNLNSSSVGPTNVYTTVEDLSKWTTNFEKPILENVDFIAHFNQPSTLDNGDPAILAVSDGETIYHAKGQFIRNYKGLTVYNHTGSDAGFKSYLGRFQDNKLSIILLSNDEDFVAYKAGMDIAEFYLSDTFKKREKATKIEPKVEEKAKYVSKTNLKDFEGIFQNNDLSSRFTVKIINGKLTMTHDRLSDVVLTELEKDKFRGVITFSADVNFERNKKNEVTALSITNFGATNVKFVKLQ
ncbi:serine hydrolase domain-containing protein [Flavobacterium humi]|uniref:Class A beta-lactamase-related serine hydrolase n=1 Tax=Flavobacterium humi TaxID=2562683 RepID=A0A4Z0LDC7_9FLAO|nr:serine hydrolase domain-containing protein [Flavobacterium humi]TGD59889.1 class A beta-lactamase-related serine hydrolase [Flavobacterium humi]